MNTRRTIMAIVIAMTMVTAVNAQTVTFDEFRDKVLSYKAERDQCLKDNDYAKALIPLQNLISLYESAEIDDPETKVSKNVIRNMEGIDLYDIACCYARLGKKRLAIESLRKAVDYGWADLGNLMWDLESNDLVSISKSREVKAIIEEINQRQPLSKLKRSAPYKKEILDSVPKFRYQPKELANLKMVRDYFKLDSVAGNGDELSQIKNVLTFCHNLIRHDGSNYAFAENDAIDLYHYYKVTGNGINCRQMATVMMEMYLSMGFKSRIVSCMPMDSNDYDSHVINVVWSETMHKWLYVDPSMNAWVMDENGTMLSIAEVRERLKDGRPLVLNEEANHNNENKQTKEHYLEYYMAKNLYILTSPMACMFNGESRFRNPTIEYIQLVPSGFDYYTHPTYTTTDPDIFWQAPE